MEVVKARYFEVSVSYESAVFKGNLMFYTLIVADVDEGAFFVGKEALMWYSSKYLKVLVLRIGTPRICI